MTRPFHEAPGIYGGPPAVSTPPENPEQHPDRGEPGQAGTVASMRSAPLCSTVRAMRILLLILASMTLAAGCTNDCDTACDAQGAYFERCLEQWGTTWEEQSYNDKDDYLARCRVVYGDQLDAEEEGSEPYRELLAICDGNLTRAEADTDCETLLE